MGDTEAIDHSYVLNLVSQVGTHTAEGFVKNEERCLRNLRKIRREINIDLKDESHDTVRLLGEIHFVKNFVIPLAVEYGEKEEDMELLLELSKLLVLLTMPIEEDESGMEEGEAHLHETKYEFCFKGRLMPFMKLVEGCLERGTTKLSGEKEKLELFLWLLKNLLSIPDMMSSEASQQLTGSKLSGQCHSDFLATLAEDGVYDVLLFLTECICKERQSPSLLILLDIYFSIFRGLTPSSLFPNTGVPLSVIDATKKAASTVDSLPTPDESARKDPRSLLCTSYCNKLLNSKQKRIQAATSMCRYSGLLQNRDTGSFREMQNPGIPGFVQTTTQLLKAPALEDKPHYVNKRKKRKVQRGTAIGQGFAKLRLFSTKAIDIELANSLRRVAEDFLKGPYRDFIQHLMKQFRKEDSRLLPADKLQFLRLVGFFTGFHSQLVKSKLDGQALGDNFKTYDWSSSPVFVNLDLWSFGYVLKSLRRYSDENTVEGQVTALATLKEMLCSLNDMFSSEREDCRALCERLENALFYEVEEFEIIFTMLREFDPVMFGYKCLRDLVLLTHTILTIVKELANKGAIVKSKRRQGRSSKKGHTKTLAMKPFTKAEVEALVEGVKQFGESYSKIRRNESFYSILQDKSEQDCRKMYTHLKALCGDDDLDAFISTYDEEVFNATIGEEETSEPEQRTSRQHREVSLREQPWIRKVLGNSVLKNVVLLIDPRYSSEILLTEEDKKIVTKLLGYAFKQTPSMLWHFSYLDIFSRVLRSERQFSYEGHDADVEEVGCSLNTFLKQVFKGFFEHAKRNPLVLFECLLMRNKADNIFLNNFYEDARQRKARAVPSVERAGDKDHENVKAIPDIDASEEEDSEAEMELDFSAQVSTTKSAILMPDESELPKFQERQATEDEEESISSDPQPMAQSQQSESPKILVKEGTEIADEQDSEEEEVPSKETSKSKGKKRVSRIRRTIDNDSSDSEMEDSV